ncbi:MAG: hypothetical protein OEZ34_02940 [Spirochaetia bacterium]|nr:hypothetical protein [Spirochaetia bacterium]
MDSDEPLQLVEFQGPFFKLKFPSHWEMEIIEDIPAFFDPMGGGALQVVSAQKNDEPVNLEDEMTQYLSQMGISFDPEKIASFKIQAGPCLACEFIKEDRFWLLNMIGQEGKLLIVMYNSDEVPDPDTVSILMNIIQSIRLEGS